jgi:hypothetical protein
VLDRHEGEALSLKLNTRQHELCGTEPTSGCDNFTRILDYRVTAGPLGIANGLLYGLASS